MRVVIWLTLIWVGVAVCQKLDTLIAVVGAK